MMLSPEELEQMTGLKQPAAQVRWFVSRGFRAERNAAGRVVVLREWLTGSAPAPKPRWEKLRA